MVAKLFFTRFQSTMERTIGHRETEKALMLGSMYNTQEALKIGLVDKVVAQDQVMSQAQEEIQQWLSIPGTKKKHYK